MGKITLHTIIGLLFFISLQSILINIIDYNKSLKKGVVVKTKIISKAEDNVSYYNRYYILDRNKIRYGEYNMNRKTYHINVGDTIYYRRLTFYKRIKVIKLKGEIIENQYGIIDYFFIIAFLVILYGYLFFPKTYKKLKQKQNENIFKNYYD